jgi:putative flippase GtrA
MTTAIAPVAADLPARRARVAGATGRSGVPVIDVVIPVFNEDRDLESCVRRLHAYLGANVPYPFRITVADNASTDATHLIALRLSREIREVRTVHLDEKGRGRALRAAWLASDAAVLAYMDVDMSTDLSALLPLVAPLISGHSDLAIGTRLAGGARVVRGSKRELISRGYNLLLHGTLATAFSDAQCGFKAISAGAARQLLPLVADNGWFFDTELLVLAQRCGLRIHEVPVDWVDDVDSRVDILPAARADLAGIARLSRSLITGALPLDEVRNTLGRRPLRADLTRPHLSRQLLSFAVIGVISTALYLLLYALFRDALPAQAANLIALVITSIGNTATNRRFTFGVRGRRHAARHQFEGLVIFALGLLVTSAALGGVAAARPSAGLATEMTALVVANLAGTALRFLLFRAWVFHPRRRATVAAERSRVS